MILLIWAAQAAWGFQVGGRSVGFPKAGRVGFWRRSATVAPLADDPPFRIGHGFDIHRLEPGRGSWEQRFSRLLLAHGVYVLMQVFRLLSEA